MPPILAQFKVI